MAQKFLNGIDVSSTTVVNGDNLDSGSTVLDVQGSQGQLFSVTNSLTGDLFSVSDISGIPILNVNSSGAVDIDGNLNLGDNNKIQLGSSQDLQIYHDGSNSYISEVGAGDLIISADNDLTFKDGSGNIMANMNASNSVELMYGNVKKFETTSTGVTVTGSSSRFLVDSASASAIDIGYYSSVRTIRALEIGGNNLRPLAILSQNFNVDSSGNATFAGNVSAQGFHIDAATLQSFQDFQSKPIDTDSGLFTVGGHGMALGYSRAISLWSTTDGVYRSWVGTNLRWDGTNYKRASNHQNNNWGNIAGIQFWGNAAATGKAIEFIIDPPENASGTGEATIGTALPAGYTALTINNDLSATFSGQVIFPSAATTKPVLPNGFISRNDNNDTSDRHDIWGISERYYPSNSTAADAWGIQWSGTPNDVVFVGGGTDVFTVSLDDGNVTASGTISASNFSGSSEGANTGDQTLPTASSLGAVTITGTQTISGTKTFSNTSNHYNGHLFFDAYSVGGDHYPHFLDGSSNSGTTINWRQYYGSSYKTHTWTSDASGNMVFTFQGAITAVGSLTGTSLDINGSADISGNLSGVDTLTATTLSVTNYGLASSDIPNNAANTTGSAGSVAWGNITSRPYIVNASNNSATATTTIANVAHATYTAAFFDFVIKNGTNVRSGTVYACHDGASTPLVEFAETSTVDLGDTSDVTLSVDISGANMRLRATTTSSTWTIKSLIRAI